MHFMDKLLAVQPFPGFHLASHFLRVEEFELN